MIDFPASPALGQSFTASNGVTYQWNGTLWLALAPPAPGGTGDFCANQTSGFPGLTTTMTTLIPTQVITGNSGLWYSTSTGRYTPPAGRYYIEAIVSGLPTVAAHVGLQLRKNGTVVDTGWDTAPAAGQYGNPSVSVTVDANGSDFFDIQGSVSSGTATLAQLTFQAFPLTGLKGPTGGPASPVVGDFCATHNTNFDLTSGGIVIPFNTVLNGNSGAYYNSANGRYTPPAGRYFIYGLWTGFNGGASGGNATLRLRKNGVSVTNSQTQMNPSGVVAFMEVSATLDANGSDFFEIFGSTSASQSQCGANQAVFGAFPTQGMTGPAGPAGPANPTNVLPNYFTGFVHSSAGGTQNLTVGAGMSADSANAQWLTSSAGFTKSLAATWAAGNGPGIGGMGPGLTVAANTWYFPFVAFINGAFDIFFDTTPIPTHIPPGTTAYRRIRPIKTTTGTPNIIAHTGKGDLLQWTTFIVETNSGFTVPLIGTPPGIQTYWQGLFFTNSTSSWGAAYYTPGQIFAGTAYSAAGAGSSQSGAALSVLTSTAPAINFTVAGTPASYSISTMGFIDDCGRND